MTAMAARAQMTISGTVRDAQTGERLSAVSVMATGSKIGTVSNEEGDFVLKIPETEREVVVSHVGYRSQRFKATDGARLNVRLTSDAVLLGEIIVSAPEDIVKQAIANIPNNYPQQANLLRTFYRETTQRGRRYIYVAEAVADMYKTSYRFDERLDCVEILKGRRLVSPQQKDTLGAKLVGGPNTAVVMDIVKNRSILFDDEELDHYSFRTEPPQNLGGRQQTVISFVPRVIMPYALFSGRLFIDSETLTFTRAELELDISDEDKATMFMLIRKPAGVRFKPRGFLLTVDYKFVEGRSYISYVRTEISFKCDWKRKLFSSPYRVTSEMVATDLNDTDVREIKRRDSFGQHQALYDRVEYFTDKDFWQSYNIIPPTESLDKAVRRLLKR